MKSFYVECQLPQVAQAEISAAFNTFNETLAWIAVQVRENPQRLPRLVSRVRVTAKMARTLAAKGVTVERSRGQARAFAQPV